jgi:hypothetical protein
VFDNISEAIHVKWLYKNAIFDLTLLISTKIWYNSSPNWPRTSSLANWSLMNMDEHGWTGVNMNEHRWRCWVEEHTNFKKHKCELLHSYDATCFISNTWTHDMVKLGLIYSVFQEERLIFWEVIVSVILSKKVYMYICSIMNGFRDRAISYYRLHKRISRCTQASNMPCPHMSCKVHWCWRWNFRKCIILGKLYQLCHLNNKYRY